MGGEKPKKAPDNVGNTADRDKNIPQKGAKMVKKAERLPELEHTPYLDYLKKEIDDRSKKAIELMNAGRLDEAFFVFKSIMDKKDFYEKKGIIIDSGIIENTIACAVMMIGYYMENGVKILNDEKEDFIFPPVKPKGFMWKKLSTAGLEDIYEIYSRTYTEKLKINEVAFQKNIAKALPFFAGCMRFTAYMLEYNKCAKNTPLSGSPLSAALQLAANINKILDEANFSDFSKDKNLSGKDKENLSHFFRERASLLSSVIPRRDEPIWTFARVSREPEFSPALEHKGIKPIRVHMGERAMLGLLKPDPAVLLNAVADNLIKGLEAYKEKETDAPVKAEAAYYEEKELAGLCLKLAGTIEFFKKNRQYLKKGGESAPLDLSDLFAKTQTPKKRLYEAQEIFGKLKILMIRVGGRKNSENFQKLAGALKKITSWDHLVLMIMESEQNEEWPKAKNADKSIDPRVELHVNLEVIKLFAKAIELNPEYHENYGALLDFLKKIGFDDKIESRFRKKLKETAEIADDKKRGNAFVILGKELTDEINMTIGVRTPAPEYEKSSWTDKLFRKPKETRPKLME